MSQEKNINNQRGSVKKNTTEEIGKKEKQEQFSSRNKKQKNDRMKAHEINRSEKLYGVLLSTLFSQKKDTRGQYKNERLKHQFGKRKNFSPDSN